MRVKGPVVTLLVGLATALVLLGLSMNATHTNRTEYASSGGRTTGTPTPTTAPTATRPSPTTATASRTRATYAGHVSGGGATVAIALRDGVAIAYVCDGRRIEGWLRGTAL